VNGRGDPFTGRGTIARAGRQQGTGSLLSERDFVAHFHGHFDETKVGRAAPGSARALGRTPSIGPETPVGGHPHDSRMAPSRVVYMGCGVRTALIGTPSWIHDGD
jgi:hypothetical protein